MRIFPGMMASSLLAMVCMAADDGGGSGGGEFSLADLADLDVSDIEEIRFETLPIGVYEFEVIAADLTEGKNKDDEKRFYADFEFKILTVLSVLEAGVVKEDLVGKTQKQRFFINPGEEAEKVQKAIGRIRAFVTDIGLDSSGKLGPMIANTKGHIFKSKLTHDKDKDDKSIVYARIKPDAKKKAA